ncbi:HipA domain-containing protein [Rhodonellum sp.]|uniref:HipA domain-containing protein n=1 Tax=Rhodonellum sp. TaxID=2231180 RepID=UPI002727F790|nr:HipA domain-containing protein [Rhodonellum sp.]MDO9552212.1 HipA domain-containing protein [Rhodonellum sp.]
MKTLMVNKCLYCYQTLVESEIDFHPRCSRKIFGTAIAPELPYSEQELEPLARTVIENHTALTGVQPKLSLHISSDKDGPKRFTIVGLWGGYILKPASTIYPQLPEVEDLTMHLAEIAKIKVVPHALIRMQSGKLAYITKRIDRTNKGKIHMEDMCQLTQRLTEDKYRGSYEQIAKAILNYSKAPGLDLVNFYEQVLFCFLTGNADMHLKNFSLIYQPGLGPVLSPAYDLLNTAIVNPADEEELALTLNGKKNRIRKSDFRLAFTSAGLDEKQQENIFNKMIKSQKSWLQMIQNSFLSQEFKERYTIQLSERIKIIL